MIVQYNLANQYFINKREKSDLLQTTCEQANNTYTFLHALFVCELCLYFSPSFCLSFSLSLSLFFSFFPSASLFPLTYLSCISVCLTVSHNPLQPHSLSLFPSVFLSLFPSVFFFSFFPSVSLFPFSYLSYSLVCLAVSHNPLQPLSPYLSFP